MKLNDEATEGGRRPEGGDREDARTSKSGSSRISMSNKRYRSLIVVCLLVLQITLLGAAATKARAKSGAHVVLLVFAAFVSSLPAFVILGVGLGVIGSSTRDLPHQRYIPLIVVATLVGNQLPAYLSAGMAAVGIYVFGLSSRPIPQDIGDGDEYTRKKADSSSGGADDVGIMRRTMSLPLQSVLATLLLIAVLLADNFFVWVVAATYKPSQSAVVGDLPTPLQDNGQIIMKYIFGDILALTKREVVNVRGMINVEWLLVSGLGLSLVAMEMQGPAMRRCLWSVAMRGVLTLAAARSIRIVSFLITVLPSQNPKCYFGHYPYPPPQEWLPWLKVGVAPQVNGGCNDLIISGHATVTSTIACIVTSIVGKPLFTAALWMFVVMDYMVEVYEGFHYSVDMFLGALMVNFVWALLAPLEASGQLDQAVTAKVFYPLHETNRLDLIQYLIPALGAYLQVVGLIPGDVAIYTMFAYTVAVVYQINRFGFQQYTQHTLFCLLYMALGVFL